MFFWGGTTPVDAALLDGVALTTATCKHSVRLCVLDQNAHPGLRQCYLCIGKRKLQKTRAMWSAKLEWINNQDRADLNKILTSPATKKNGKSSLWFVDTRYKRGTICSMWCNTYLES